MGSARPKSRKYTYVAYERKGSELPVAVAETAEEISALLGLSVRTVIALCSGREEKRVRHPFVVMRILDDDDDE